LKQQVKGKSDSWGIQWYLSVFNASGLVLYPPITLVQNIGHDGSGTHCKIENEDEEHNVFKGFDFDSLIFPLEISIDIGTYSMVKKYLHEKYGFIPRGRAWLRTELNKFFKN
jgi:hypothetical protein